MDQFGQQADAARLLAAAASALKESTRKVHLACRGRSRRASANPLSQTLLELIQGAVQLVAAAYDISQSLERQTRKRSTKSASTGSTRPAKRRRKPAKTTRSR